MLCITQTTEFCYEGLKDVTHELCREHKSINFKALQHVPTTINDFKLSVYVRGVINK